jgi:L-fuconolactonase
VFDALIRPTHLPHIVKIAQRYPSLSIVIDHCAKPQIAFGVQAAWQPWADGMAALAALPNVSCKLSGLFIEAGKSPGITVCKTWVEYVCQVFGTERMMWGSDWPVLELVSNYQMWLETCKTITKFLSTQQAENIYGNNAEHIYKLIK